MYIPAQEYAERIAHIKTAIKVVGRYPDRYPGSCLKLVDWLSSSLEGVADGFTVSDKGLPQYGTGPAAPSIGHKAIARYLGISFHEASNLTAVRRGTVHSDYYGKHLDDVYPQDVVDKLKDILVDANEAYLLAKREEAAQHGNR